MATIIDVPFSQVPAEWFHCDAPDHLSDVAYRHFLLSLNMNSDKKQSKVICFQIKPVKIRFRFWIINRFTIEGHLSRADPTKTFLNLKAAKGKRESGGKTTFCNTNDASQQSAVNNVRHCIIISLQALHDCRSNATNIILEVCYQMINHSFCWQFLPVFQLKC